MLGYFIVLTVQITKESSKSEPCVSAKSEELSLHLRLTELAEDEFVLM
jgi:hypothetical protein